MKLLHLTWVLGLAGALTACNSGDALQGCDDYNEATGTCGGGTGGTGGGTGGTGGTGNVGGAVTGACTNAEDTAVYDALEYTPNQAAPTNVLTGSEAASQMASDCVFGNPNSIPAISPGCGPEAGAVLTCRADCEDEVQALTVCVVDCQQSFIQEVTGEMLSSGCADCYGESVSCSAANCASSGCSVPDSDPCVQCRCEMDCTPGFDRCSGLPPSGDCG
jgi:hypothetical protein